MAGSKQKHSIAESDTDIDSWEASHISGPKIRNKPEYLDYQYCCNWRCKQKNYNEVWRAMWLRTIRKLEADRLK